MIKRAVVVPCPPLLVPELAGGAAAETASVRVAAVHAAHALAEVAPRWLAVAADPAGPCLIVPESAGSFAGYGVDVPVTLAATASEPDSHSAPDLPLPALVAAWLRQQASATEVTVRLLSPAATAEQCRQAGARLAERLGGDGCGLLVLGDGAAAHGPRAPLPEDARAAGFDTRVRDALASADAAALLALDAGFAAELGVTGRTAWQVLAGAAEAEGGHWCGRVTYSAAPFGVGYHVAVWDRS